MLNGTTLDHSTQSMLMALSSAIENAKVKGTADADIQALAAGVKQKIDSHLVNLRGSSAEFAEKISDLIANKSWAELPSPAEMETTLEQINEVATALSQVMDNVMTDIGEIFRVLMELNRRIMLDNREAQVLSIKASVDEGKAAIADREHAAWTQFGAELASSIAQVVSGLCSMKGAAKSLGKVKEAVTASKEAHEMTVGKGDDRSGSLLELKGKSEQAAKRMGLAEEKLKTLPANDPNHGTLKQEYASASGAYEKAKSDFEMANQAVEQRQADSMNARLVADAKMQLYKAKSELIGAAGQALASAGRASSALLNLSADKKDINKSLEEKSYQASQETVASAREVLRGLINSLQSIEQVLSNLNSLLARNTA